MLKICLICEHLSCQPKKPGRVMKVPGGGLEELEPEKPASFGCTKGYWTIPTLVPVDTLRKLMATALTCGEYELDNEVLKTYTINQ